MTAHGGSTAQSGSQGPVLPQRHSRKQVGGNSPVLRNRGPLAPPTPLALQNLGKATQAEAKLGIVVMGGPTSASPPLCGPEGWRSQLGAWTADLLWKTPDPACLLPESPLVPIPDPVAFSSSLG